MNTEWVYESEWFEENNITKEIKKYLESNGFKILKCNEDKREKGHDIEAIKNSIRYVIEVKGYPSDKYVNGPQRGLKKPTNPKLQSKHWFGEALLSLIRAKSKDSQIRIAFGLPLFSIYENMMEGISPVGKLLELGCIFVSEEGQITTYNF